MKHYFIVSWIIFALALSACQDEYLFNVSLEYPSETVGNVLTVDAWENEFTISLTSDGDWHVEKDSRFFNVTPMYGSGNAILRVKVQANQGEERKEGCLGILFQGHDEKNQELFIEQKCAADYDGDMALPIGTSNKIYAIGYSYDATGEWASPNSVKIEIFDTKQLSEEGKHVVGPTQASLVENIITGNSISEMTNALAVKAEVKGGFGKFKAEANASFDMNHAKNTNYEYATTYFNLDVRTASFDTDLLTLCEEYMTDDAWYAINGVPRENKRTHTRKKSLTHPLPKGLKIL